MTKKLKLTVLTALFAVFYSCQGKESPQIADKGAKGENSSLARGQSEVLAKVGEYEITSEDFERYLNAQPPYWRDKFGSRHGRMNLLNKLVNRLALYKKGVDEGILKDESVLSSIEDYKQSIVADAWKNRFLSEEKGKVKDDDLRRYFERNKFEYRRGKEEPQFEKVKDRVMADFLKNSLTDYIERLKKELGVQINIESFENDKGDKNGN